jgi:uncharacterized phage protein (TIGR02218 family)
MKTASPELIALLNSGQQFKMADCYTFTLASGAVLRYTSWDERVTYGGHVFAIDGPIITRGRVRTVLGVEVATLDLVIAAGPQHLVEGLTFLQASAAGSFDGAVVQLDRVFFSEAGAVVGGFIHFLGEVGPIDPSRTQVEMTVNSYTHRLNAMFPRNVYQPSCMHSVFNARCGLNRVDWAVASTVVSATRTSIVCGLAQAAGYFDLGTVAITGGPLNGSRRTVKRYTPGSFELLNPLPSTPGVGVSFTAYPGCARLQSVCEDKFGNLAHFRAMPYVPSPETAR